LVASGWLLPFSALADSADQAWAAIEAMDGGPAGRPQSRREAQAGVSQHLQSHLRLLENFIQRYPQDPRRFEAELRRSALMASLGKLLNDSSLLRQGRQLAEALEKSPNLTSGQAANAGFQRVSLLFLEAQAAPDRSRDTLLNATRNFVTRYPNDLRGARLLAEVATIFDAAPTTKRELLEAALRSAREPDLVARIRDDLQQMDLIGQRVPLEFPTLGHGRFALGEQRGKVVVVLFWAADSPHSLWWLRENLPALQEFPSSAVAVVTISLDLDRSLLESTLAEARISFPTGWDGLGWESPLARSYGINRLPTVWIFDRTGRLRVGNGTANPAGLVRRFLKENL
jgi:hypothetical protein